MRRNNAPIAALPSHDSAASRFLCCLPALLLVQLLIAVWVAWSGQSAGRTGFVLLLPALANQGLLLLRSLPVLLLLSWWPLTLAAPRQRWYWLGAGWSLFVLLQVGLEQYFQVAQVPLGADLFGYSLAEIRTTLGVGDAFAGVGWAVALSALALLWAALAGCMRLRTSMRGVLPVLLLMGIMAWWLPAVIATGRLHGEAERNQVASKLAYFVADSVRYLRRGAGEAESLAAQTPPTATAEQPLDPHHPFLHVENTPDTLGEYFNPTADGRKPNVVVIVVEGLGRSFSGPDAALGSFTPFLDQLAADSLYFRNFMANQGRTFGVLPSLFGSLPLAEQGFAALGADMPAHAGLFNLLRQQGYHSAFYSGTDADFDNERGYLQLQQLEEIIDLRNFGSGYQRNPYSAWGYPDRELVARVLADTSRLRPPFVMAMQTISMHTAYQFPGQQAYLRRVEKRLDALQIAATARSAYRKHADIYSAILYTDDQLRHYFEAVKSAPWYADTIFVITGDHRLPEIPQDTYIERYHVPLIIFSPLLKRPAQIAAVSSHLDVTPSLLALLSHTYGLQRPASSSWLGSGLDMSTQFRSRGEFPLKRTKTSAEDFVSGRWFLHDGALFELGDGITASRIEDAGLLARVRQRLTRYRAANAVLLRDHVLSPEGGTPALVAYDGAAAARPASTGAVQAIPAGLAVEAVTVQRTGSTLQVTATIANGDPVASPAFMPLAVLTDADGQELDEGYASSIRLQAHERRTVLLSLVLPEPATGRYRVAVRPADPQTGKSLGRGRYHVRVEATETR